MSEHTPISHKHLRKLAKNSKDLYPMSPTHFATFTNTAPRAVYGFSFYLLFFTLFIIYVLWSFLPTEKLGLTYLPDKYFALCLPVVVLTGLGFFIFFIYPAICTSLTPHVDELATVIDVASVQRICGYGENIEINDWEQLKCITEQRQIDDQPYSYNKCEICKIVHRPPNFKPIATLRFMDLSEINDSIFGA